MVDVIGDSGRGGVIQVRKRSEVVEIERWSLVIPYGERVVSAHTFGADHRCKKTTHHGCAPSDMKVSGT